MIYPPANAKTKDCPKCKGEDSVWIRIVQVVGLCYSYPAWCCSELDCDYEEPLIHNHTLGVGVKDCPACDL